MKALIPYVLLVAVCAVLALALVEATNEARPKKSELLAVSSATYSAPVDCSDGQRAISYYRQAYTTHRTKMRATPAVPRVWYRNCKVVARRAAEWRDRAATAREELRAWTEAQYTLPPTNDWRTSVRLTQRIYPGTDQWLLYISDREGGWGPFVMNHQGSGAGGWLQFMASTFYAYMDDARADVARKGYEVPPGIWEWTHPLGQALTGAYMRSTGRDGCHWCLR